MCTVLVAGACRGWGGIAVQDRTVAVFVVVVVLTGCDVLCVD